jgi:hypothetical protein
MRLRCVIRTAFRDSMLRCRNWGMGQTEGGNSMAVMKPLLDMLNHDRASQNEMRFRGSAFELVHRGPGIKPGEEVIPTNGKGHQSLTMGWSTAAADRASIAAGQPHVRSQPCSPGPCDSVVGWGRASWSRQAAHAGHVQLRGRGA